MMRRDLRAIYAQFAARRASEVGYQGWRIESQPVGYAITCHLLALFQRLEDTGSFFG